MRSEGIAANTGPESGRSLDLVLSSRTHVTVTCLPCAERFLMTRPEDGANPTPPNLFEIPGVKRRYVFRYHDSTGQSQRRRLPPLRTIDALVVDRQQPHHND